MIKQYFFVIVDFNKLIRELIVEVKVEVIEEVEDGKEEDDEEEIENFLVSIQKGNFIQIIFRVGFQVLLYLYLRIN